MPEQRLVHEVWVEDPDGTRGQARFLGKPESYDDAAQASKHAAEYNDSHVGWGRPLPHKRYYVRTATVTKEYAEPAASHPAAAVLARMADEVDDAHDHDEYHAAADVAAAGLSTPYVDRWLAGLLAGKVI